MFSTLFIATHVSILTLGFSSNFNKLPSSNSKTFRYHFLKSVDSVKILNPLHFKRMKIKPISCYAFLTSWLLPSLLWECLYLLTSFQLKFYWGPYRTVWAVSLSTMNLSAHGPFAQKAKNVFGVSLSSVRSENPPSLWSALPQFFFYEHST